MDYVMKTAVATFEAGKYEMERGAPPIGPEEYSRILADVARRLARCRAVLDGAGCRAGREPTVEGFARWAFTALSAEEAGAAMDALSLITMKMRLGLRRPQFVGVGDK